MMECEELLHLNLEWDMELGVGDAYKLHAYQSQ
jgi:hypothetical protein